PRALHSSPTRRSSDLAVVLAGCLQLLLALAKAGNLGSYFPSSVILGMLAAIGITIIIQQIPYGLGIAGYPTSLAAFTDAINFGADRKSTRLNSSHVKI